MQGNSDMAILLERTLDLDLRISLQWDNGESEVELHVIEPSGMKCSPFSNLTTNAIMSTDCRGFGPVVYTSRTARSHVASDNVYDVSVKLASRGGYVGPVVARVTIEVMFGRGIPEESRDLNSLSMANNLPRNYPGVIPVGNSSNSIYQKRKIVCGSVVLRDAGKLVHVATVKF